MTDPISKEALDDLRHTYREVLDAAKRKGQVFAPVKSIETAKRAFDELAEKRAQDAEALRVSTYTGDV